MQSDEAKLTLKFEGRPKPKLVRVEFWPPGSTKSTVTPAGSKDQAWIALGLCFIRYKLWASTDGKTTFRFTAAPGPSPVASLGDALSDTKWPKNMFPGHCLKNIFKGDNPRGRNEERTRLITISPEDLPPQFVTILWDGGEPDLEGLKELAIAVEKQWKPGRTYPRRKTASPIEATVTASIAAQLPSSAALRNDQEQKHSAEPLPQRGQAPQLLPSSAQEALQSAGGGKRRAQKSRRKRKAAARFPSRGNRRLADWFRVLSLDNIKTYIIAANKMSLEKNQQELYEMDTECAIVIAEKLADGDCLDYWAFYVDDRGEIPDNIKFAVSTAIEADYDLFFKVKKVVMSSEEFFVAWFEESAPFHSEDVVWGMKGELADAFRKRAFRAQVEFSSLRWMIRYIAIFKDYPVERTRPNNIPRICIQACLKNNLAAFRAVLKEENGREWVQAFLSHTKGLLSIDETRRIHQLLKITTA